MTEQSSKKSIVVAMFTALMLSACAGGETGDESGTGGSSSTGSGG